MKLLLLLLFPLTLVAQEIRIADFPAERYQGGKDAFYRYLAKNLKYPLEARQSTRIGTAIVGFTLSAEGKLQDLEIVNPLGKGIDDNIRQVFSELADQWTASPGDAAVRMYLPISYTLNGKPFYRINPQDDQFISEVIVNGYGALRYSYDSREQLINKVYKYIDRKKYKRALIFADELIRRDPLNKEWYLLRSSINEAKGDNEAVCQDLTKIQVFLNFPVTQELMQTYCR